MYLGELTGPVIHVGIAIGLAFLFKLNLPVTVFCGILPDLVDKPLGLLGIGGGRYIGHTLLFAVLVVIAFFIWKRKFGFSAIIGLASHLLLDINDLVPWFYPFKSYEFYHQKFSFSDWFSNYLVLTRLGYELVIVAIFGLAVFIVWWLYRRHAKRHKQE